MFSERFSDMQFGEFSCSMHFFFYLSGKDYSVRRKY